MKRLIKIMGILALVCVFTASAFAGMEDRFSDIELKQAPDNYIEFPEITAPSGNPTSNYGWLYVKDNSGTSTLYFEDDGGTVTAMAPSATAWSIFAPTQSFTWSTIARAYTSSTSSPPPG